jgi:hypothetical protein
MKRKSRGKHPRPAFELAEPGKDELDWLERRRALLVRSIAEMEHHQLAPNLSPDLMPNVGELLIWAKWELARVDAAIEKFSDSESLPSEPPPVSDPPSRVTNESRRGRRERA